MCLYVSNMTRQTYEVLRVSVPEITLLLIYVK